MSYMPLLLAWNILPPIEAHGLIERLTEPRRTYHNIHHINQLLIDAHRVAAADDRWTRPLVYAILYHDAIYDPTAKDNEEQSAQFWERDSRRIMPYLPAQQTEVEMVAQTIRCTANHFERPIELLSWQHAMLDLDLGGLGASSNQYRANSLLIEQEYALAGITEDVFLPGRKAFLERALATDRLFYYVHKGLDAQARHNMEYDLRQVVERIERLDRDPE